MLLNGVPGKIVHCRRGVRQGDPLSYLLFVLAADYLQALINKAKDMNLLKLPIPLQSFSDFLVVQYIDDTLIIMEGDPRQLFFLKTLLQNFSDSIGLKVNYNKSMMLPVNMSEERLDHLEGSLPFTYLGLPLGLTKPRVQDFLSLVNKCERRLGGVSSMLNQASRLQITNAVLSALPVYYMCTLELPKAVIKQINKFIKHCLWRGSNINGRALPKAAWEMVCLSKEEGGLGIINIEVQNQSLLMKNLDKFFNKRDIPWVTMAWEKHYKNGKLPGQTKKGSFWWRDVKLIPQFKDLAIIQLKNGETCMFWKDKWLDQPLELEFPKSYSFVKNKTITVNKAFNLNSITNMFNLPLSQTAFDQVMNLQQTMGSINLENVDDIWTYTGGSTKFSSAKTYRKLIGHHQNDPAYKWIWKSSCQPKHKVSYWLLLNDRLSTRNILRRKHIHLESYNCELCSQGIEETSRHLFFSCPFAQQCWGFFKLMVSPNSNVSDNFSALKCQIHSQFFVEMIILVCWAIWLARNELIFNARQTSLQECRRGFFKEIKMVNLRVKSSLSSSFDQWLQSLEMT